MLAYKWGIKTIYYSLINKVGAKVSVENTEVKTLDLNLNTDVNFLEEIPEEDCEACKL
jgi:hypothetical protein